jgi:predicted secreted protein
MGIVAGIVVFSCTWWLVFFMLVSKGLEVDVNPMIGTPKGAPKTFSFKQRFWKITKITCVIYIVLDLLLRHDCLLWILN